MNDNEEYLKWSDKFSKGIQEIEQIEYKGNSDPWVSTEPIYFKKFLTDENSDFVLQNTVEDEAFKELESRLK